MVVVGLRFGVSNLVSRRWQVGPTEMRGNGKEVWILELYKVEDYRHRKPLLHE